MSRWEADIYAGVYDRICIETVLMFEFENASSILYKGSLGQKEVVLEFYWQGHEISG